VEIPLLFRDTGNQIRTRSAGILILTVVIILGMAGISRAVDVQVRAESEAISSDNITRALNGFETDGFLLTLESDVTISGEVGLWDWDLIVGGGWESLDTGEAVDDVNFRILLNARTPWLNSGYLAGSAGVSEEIEEPETTDIIQERLRTRSSEVRIEAGMQTSRAFSWRALVGNRTEERRDRDLSESRGEIGWRVAFDAKRSLIIDTAFSSGSDDFDENSWTGSSLSLDFRQQENRFSSRGYRLIWEEQTLKQAVGPSGRSELLSTRYYYEMVGPTGWSFSSDLGLDGIKGSQDDMRWETHIMLSASSAPGTRFRLNTSLSSISTIPDPFADERIAWTRDNRVRAGLAWSVTRLYTIEPIIQFRLLDLFGNGIANRSDETMLLRLETRWALGNSWSVDLNAHTEDRTSSQVSYDLYENRLEMRISGTFL
jgi:hypothetical protein